MAGPIERNGKHWCDPAGNDPDEDGRYECPCGTEWQFWPEHATWAEAGTDLSVLLAPAADDEAEEGEQ